MTGLLGTVFLTSLVGSLHCAGMCGGLVACYSGGRSGASRGAWLGHAAYHGGRLVTYAGLGLAFGALGAAVDVAGAMAGVNRLAALVGGGLLIASGIVVIARGLGLAVWVPRVPGRLQSGIARLLGGVGDRRPEVRAGLLGLLSALLPCGWLYAFAALAAGTGGPLRGMAVMAVFWVGTVPVLLGLGVAVRSLAAPIARRIPTLTALAMIAIGTLWVTGRALPSSAAAPAACHDAGAPTALVADDDGR